MRDTARVISRVQRSHSPLPSEKEHLERVHGLLPARHGQKLALNGFEVADSGDVRMDHSGGVQNNCNLAPLSRNNCHFAHFSRPFRAPFAKWRNEQAHNLIAHIRDML